METDFSLFFIYSEPHSLVACSYTTRCSGQCGEVIGIVMVM